MQNRYFRIIHQSAVILGLGLFSIVTLAAPLPKDISPKKVKKMGATISKLYDPARSVWIAEKIRVAGAPRPAGAEQNFKPLLKKGLCLLNGDKASTAPTNHSKLKNFKIASGKLSFTTQKGGKFFWMNTARAPEATATEFKSAISLIRIKQSLASSEWRVMNGNRIHRPPQVRAPVLTLQGTDWQEWRIDRKVFPFSIMSGYHWGLATETPGNKVEIEWIKIGVEENSLCFRKTFNFESKPFDAALCLPWSELISVYVNGVELKEYSRKRKVTPSKQLVRLSGLAKYFRLGENVIAVSIDYLGVKTPIDFFLQGMIREKNGKVVIIKSDKSWKGRLSAAAGWRNLGFDDKTWKSCLSAGPPKGVFGRSRDGLFFNPPYYGPIEVENPDLKYFFYNENQALKFDIKVYPNNFMTKYGLRWELRKNKTGKTVKIGVIAQGHAPEQLFQENLVIPAPNEPGAYEFCLQVVIDKKIAAERVEELIVIGKIKQRQVMGTNFQDGLDLELEDEVDLTDPASPYQVFSFSVKGQAVESPIRNTSLGTYRESGNKVYDMFGFGVEHKRIYEPYLVEVDIPDDKERVMSVRTVGMSRKEGVLHCDGDGRRGWPVAAPGVYTGFDQAISGKWRKLRFIIFPKNPVTGFMFTTNKRGTSAAAAKVRIYRIKNDLPALEIPSSSDRLTGIHIEDLRIIAKSFAGEDGVRFSIDESNVPHQGLYQQWYVTFENLIKYMRFCGENLSIAGIYMYCPDNREIWNTREDANAIELMGRMFAANDLKVMLGVEYARNREMRLADDVTDEQLARGAYSIKVVSKKGEQLHTGCGDMDDIYEPSVRQGLLDLVKGVSDSYAKTPGIIGVALQEGKNWSPGAIAGNYLNRGYESILDFGYGDPATAAFERDTGIEVPVDSKDPKRFKKRYDWIMSKHRDRWIQWRNDATYEINREIGEILTGANPDWKTYIFPMLGGVKEYVEGATPLEMLRLWSFDPRPYKENDDLLFGSYYTRRIRYSDKLDHYLELRQWSNDPGLLVIADNSVIHLHDGFYESIPTYPKDWYYSLVLACDYVCPAERGYLKAFTMIMSHATPLVMAQTWVDVNMMSGHEQARREMNRVFQVIPRGKYQNLNGKSFNPNIVIRACENKAGLAFYVVNPTRWPVESNISFENVEKCVVSDLAIGLELPVANGKISVNLKPFETRVFQVINKSGFLSNMFSSSVAIMGAEARIIDSERANAAKFAADQLKIYEFCKSLPKSELQRALRTARLVVSCSEMEKIAEKIIKAAEKKDYLTIAKLTEPYPMMVWGAFLKKLMKVDGAPSASSGVIRVDVGSKKSWTDSDGNLWVPDQKWLNGFHSWGSVEAVGMIKRPGVSGGAKVKYKNIFKSEGFGMKGYRFKVPNGEYQVKLHFAEYWVKSLGQRLFNIKIQGKTVAKNFDILKKGGGNALPLNLNFPAKVKDGLLSIDFKKIKDNPFVNGIEIIKK